jgi:hypothetical protein
LTSSSSYRSFSSLPARTVNLIIREEYECAVPRLSVNEGKTRERVWNGAWDVQGVKRNESGQDLRAVEDGLHDLKDGFERDKRKRKRMQKVMRDGT